MGGPIDAFPAVAIDGEAFMGFCSAAGRVELAQALVVAFGD